MLSWIFPLRPLAERFPCPAAGFGLLVMLLVGSSGFSAEVPAAVAIEAEIDSEAALGAPIQIAAGDYPPQSPGGWFAFESGNDAGDFLLNETTGAILLNRPDKLESWRRSPATLTIEYGRPAETAGQTTRRKFLRAAGLSEREISRQLGLVTRYTITLRAKFSGPEFPPRALHFYWPAEGRMVNEVRALGSSGEEIRYRLLSQHPENWIEIDPETGMLGLTKAELARSTEAPWRGVVEACDASGRTAKATVWITEPLALPTLSVPAITAFWPAGTLTAIRGTASDRIQSFLSEASTWRFDPSKFSPPEIEPAVSQPADTVVATSETLPTQPESEAAPASSDVAETAAPVSSSSWYFALFAVAIVSMLYMISRRRKSSPEKNSETSGDDQARNAVPRKRPAAKRERTRGENFSKDRTERKRAQQDSTPEKEFEWEAVLESVGADDPDSDDWPSPSDSTSPMTTLEMDGPKSNRPMLPPELFASSVPAELREGLQATLVGEDGEPAPSTEELQRLLSLLDDNYSVGQEPQPAPIPPAAIPKPRSEAEPDNSISDYMNNLLAKYSKPGASATPDPATSIEEFAPTKAKPITPARTRRSEIPEPVYNYDREVTRSQLEQLRETSNLNAAHAIRLAASRRRRRHLLRWSLLVVVALIIYAVRQYIVS